MIIINITECTEMYALFFWHAKIQFLLETVIFALIVFWVYVSL